MPEEIRKIHEDFEALHRSICWECGEKIIESVGNSMAGFSAVIQAIEKELK
jgi:hypothetical protein